MKAVITIVQHFTVEIDGKPVHGEFKVCGEWEGMVKLECSSPHGALIIREPCIAHVNKYDLIPKMFGGNAVNGAKIRFEAEVVRADCGHIGTAETGEFKRPSLKPDLVLPGEGAPKSEIRNPKS